MKNEELIYRAIANRGGYATVPELASILSSTPAAVQKNRERGKYTKVRQLTGNGSGRGGKVWQIHISDPHIPDNIKLQYYDFICSLKSSELSTAPGGGAEALSSFPGPSALSFCTVRDRNELAGSARVSVSREVNFDSSPDTSIKRGQCPISGPATFSQLLNEGIEIDIYSSAPEWARKKADKYLQILKASDGMKGGELRDFVSTWNHKHRDFKTSYESVLVARKDYAEQGIAGLLARYGKTSGRTSIKDAWFEYFKSVYLKEGAPSLYSCWINTFGYMRINEPDSEINGFPSPASFLRRLEREIPKDSIYLSRHGREAWNRKYGNFIDRDYSNLKPGECIVGDHAQVDVAVMLPNGKICFPWVTTWRDLKSGKWLGWLFHHEPPNSDHVFQSFYYAVKEWGLPSDIYIDNGRDYRCRDFAGGRKFYKLSLDEIKTTSMVSLLGITPHFSLPRCAQSKTIERDFLKNKEWFSKHMQGYRGGHIKERPERLKLEIKSGHLLTWDEYEQLMDSFIVNVLNKTPSQGKVLHGRSPDEMWEIEHRETKRVSLDALRLFCARTSKSLTIGRNGVLDGEIGFRYWAEWMAGLKGTKVYLRRDVKSYQEAWVFRAQDDEYLGKAYIAETVPALCRTDIEKAKLKDLMARKKQAEKITKTFIEIKDVPSPSEIVTHMAAGVQAVNKLRGYEPREREEVKTTEISNTALDKAIQREQEMLKEGTYDLSMIQPREHKKKIRVFECEK